MAIVKVRRAVIPMDRLKRVKGFSLLELIIVIGVLGVLVSITSVVTAGFIKSANIRTYNAAAQRTYTGMQDLLIDFEVKQDYKAVDMDTVKNGSPGDYPDNIPITYLTIEYLVIDGSIEQFTVTAVYGNVASQKVPATLNSSDTGDEKAAFDKLNKLIADRMGPQQATGFYDVYIDFENYTVDSACYRLASVSGNTVTSDQPLVEVVPTRWSWNGNAAATGKLFSGWPDLTNARNNYSNGWRTGSYPYLWEVDPDLTWNPPPAPEPEETPDP
jgi:prepilin-type N-terminal cleavage/methylation domain-containing protein